MGAGPRTNAAPEKLSNAANVASVDIVKRTSIFLTALLVASATLGAARAERTFDDEDVRGPFDLAALNQSRRQGDQLLFSLVTHERWSIDKVRDGGFAIRVDSDADAEFDRYVLIEWKNAKGPGGKLKARIALPSGEVIDRQPVRHPKPRRLSVWLDRRVLGIEPGAFHINAYSVFYGDRCPDEGCRDFVPDDGRMRVSFGGVCAENEPDIVGTPDDDKIFTRGRRVVVTSLGGDDVVKVRRGSAIVCGGDGRDILVGGGRADYLAGGDGNDQIRVRGTFRRANEAYGGRGNDLLYGGDESDRLFAGPGDDYAAGRDGDDFLDGGRGRDDLRGGPGTDTCTDGRNTGGC